MCQAGGSQSALTDKNGVLLLDRFANVPAGRGRVKTLPYKEWDQLFEIQTH